MIYVASSWRNPLHTAVIAALKASGLEHYDFRNPDSAFGWSQVLPFYRGTTDQENTMSPADYLEAMDHPTAMHGFAQDFAHMQKCDTMVLVLPCGRSAHLELGWAIGQGKRTAILLDDPVTPELMYHMVDHLSDSLFELLGWLGVED